MRPPSQSPPTVPGSSEPKRRKAWPTRWVFAQEPDAAAVARLQTELRCSRLFARVLVRRGLGEAAQAQAFIKADLGGLHDPSLLPGMDAAVERLERAPPAKQNIVVFPRHH